MELVDFIIHIDVYLERIVAFAGAWTYVVLFVIVFVETGLVIMPFLPGDSLLFAVGALAGGGFLDVWVAYMTMLAAAIVGDTVNYSIGRFAGMKLFAADSRFFNRAHLAKTEAFYAKYGGKTIILARFVPIVRTFAPFVAGVARMHYATFILFNVTGAFLWVTSLLFEGYFFGGLPFVQDNFEYVVFGIIGISVLPMVFEYVKHKRAQR
jgi:membrane-associated protein